MSHTSISPTEILKIQQEGYNAYLQGIHIRDCPYSQDTSENTEKQQAWFRGYAASRTDRARANRKTNE